MSFFRAVLAMFLVWPLAAAAQDKPLTLLETGLTAQGWEAVGRIDIGANGFCTGALISDRFGADRGPLPVQSHHRTALRG